MFSFFRRQKTSESDKNAKGDKDKKDGKHKEKYSPGLSSPGTSAKRNDEHGKEKPKESNVTEVPIDKALTSVDEVTTNGNQEIVSVGIKEDDSPRIKNQWEEKESVSSYQTTPDAATASIIATERDIKQTPNVTSDISVTVTRNESNTNSASASVDGWPSTLESDAIAKGDVTISTPDTGGDLVPTLASIGKWTSKPESVVIDENGTSLKTFKTGNVLNPLSGIVQKNSTSSSSSSSTSSDSGVIISDDVTVSKVQNKSDVSQSLTPQKSLTSTPKSDVIVNGVAVTSTAPPGSNMSPSSWTFRSLKSWNSASNSDQENLTKVEPVPSEFSPTFSLVIPVQSPLAESKQQGAAETDLHHTQTPLGLLTSTKINILSSTPPVDEKTDKKVHIISGWKKLEDVQKENEARELEKRNLVGQETRFQEQLTELQAQLTAKDTETNKLFYKLEDLQRDVSVKSSGMDRLQAELEAAHKESQCVRQKLRLLENDVSDYRHKNVELSDELLKKTDEVTSVEGSQSLRVIELEASLKEMDEKMKELQTELEEIRVERDMLEEERAEMEAEREEEMKIVQEALEEVQDEKTEIQTRYEKDFEKLRTVNTDREQQLLNDFEWKLREVEQACKRRLEDKDKKAEEKIKSAHAEMAAKIQEAEKQLGEVQQLKKFEAEALQLRGMTHEQQKSLRLAARQTEQLQVSELILKEDVARLRSDMEKEKKTSSVLLMASEKRISDLDTKLHNRLDLQKTDLNDQWEQRLKRECTRLKAELDHLHEEEKHLVVESLKIQKEQEAQVSKQGWEKRLQESLKEISTLKDQIVEKEVFYQREIEKAQTNTDRDILELRRKLDKMDMSYQSQIEKLKEDHEKEMEQLTWESGRKIQQVEQNWQLQTSSNRTTLELVKEQMERDSQTRIEDAENKHRIELEQQWDRLNQEKEEEMQQLEENHLKQLQSVKEEFTTSLKDFSTRESDLVTANTCLEKQLSNHCALVGDLQGNADRLYGSVQMLNDKVTNHSNEILFVEKQALEKLREREGELEMEKQTLLKELKEQHTEQATLWQSQIMETKEQVNHLTKSLEETRALNDSRPSRTEDIKRIADLQQAIIERDKRLVTASEELRLYELELLNRDTLFISQPVTGVIDPLQYMHGPKKKGGGKGTNTQNQPVASSKHTGQSTQNPLSSSKSSSKVSASHSSRARSADYPAIKVLTKSPTRKNKKSSHASQSSTISTL